MKQTCIVNCIVKNNKIPLVPDDLIKLKRKRNGSADVCAFINNNWIFIGYTPVCPLNVKNLTAKCVLPHPYNVKLMLKYNVK